MWLHIVFNAVLLLLIGKFGRSTTTTGSKAEPTVGIIVRSYKGDETRCMQYLIPTLHAFVDRTKFHIVFVLDGESEEDHKYGEMLLKQGFHVDYEFLPDFVATGPTPYGVLNGTHYATVGYTRQIFSTFFFDLYLHTDIIGVMDCDNMIYTYPVVRDIVDEKGRIFAAGLRNNYYGDRHAMKEIVYHDFMYTDVMPKFIYRDTFKKLRHHFFNIYNTTSFSSVWKEIAKTNISPVNILLEYGVKYIPDNYRLVMSNDTHGMITIGSNRPTKTFSVIGCCHMYPNITCPVEDYKNHTEHILFFNNVYLDDSYQGHESVAFRNNVGLVNEHYRNVHKAMNLLSPTHLATMKSHCEKLIQSRRRLLRKEEPKRDSLRSMLRSRAVL